MVQQLQQTVKDQAAWANQLHVEVMRLGNIPSHQSVFLEKVANSLTIEESREINPENHRHGKGNLEHSAQSKAPKESRV